jgi:hypothetical protein
MLNVNPTASGMSAVSLRNETAAKRNAAPPSPSSGLAPTDAGAPSAPSQSARNTQPTQNSGLAGSGYLSMMDSSANVAEAYVKLATPNSGLQEQMSKVVNAKQFAPVDTNIVANVSSLVNKLFDFG